MRSTATQRVSADDEGLEHGVDKAALHPLKEATYAAVETLLREVASVFPDGSCVGSKNTALQ